MVGDDFRGNTRSFLIQRTVSTRAIQARPAPSLINAIGFPTIANLFQIGGLQGNARFANIMREIADTHSQAYSSCSRTFRPRRAVKGYRRGRLFARSS